MGIFSKKKKEKPPIPETTKNNVAKVLQLCYEQKIAPFERLHAFEAFHSPPLFAPEFNSKPMVLFLGQQSVGKTTMIKHLMGGQEYPGSYIGLETATDCFTVIHYDETVRTIMGTTLAADSNKPFQCLNQFGSSFLKNLRGASLPVNLLKHVYLIDTPGILSGQKQTISREYDYASVVKFMADKIKIVLNKTDYVDQVELSRFWWNLSKIMATPEIPKFFIGSFLISYINAEDDFADLFKELERLPIQHLSQKVNEVTKRTKSVQVHALIMDQLLKKMCWKSEKQRTLVLRDKKLKAVFLDIKQKYNMTDSDLPDYESFKDHAQKSYLKSWNKINPKMLVKLEEFLMKDVTKIYQILRYDEGDAAVLKQEFDVILEQRKQHQNRQNPVSRKTSTQSTITLNYLAQKSCLKSWNEINLKMLVKLEEFLMKDVTKIYQILRYAALLKREFDVILEQRKQYPKKGNPVSRSTSTLSTITMNSKPRRTESASSNSSDFGIHLGYGV